MLKKTSQIYIKLSIILIRANNFSLITYNLTLKRKTLTIIKLLTRQ
jgi:hypothetical protein